MEYEHVFIPDGGWQRDQHNEDERRLYYVAMTRAQKTLTLFNNRHEPNRLISGLEGEAIHSRTIMPPQTLIDAAKQSQYTLLTLSDIELSYAGCFVEHAPIHQALKASINIGTKPN